jgi:pyridoxine 4-dehydrogenase
MTADQSLGGRFTFLGGPKVHRMGYGAMQLAGPGVFGPPKDESASVAVLRAAVEAGVDHIDTSDFYGPHVVNRIIKTALHPYPEGLTLVTKVGAKRGEDGSWNVAISPDELTQAVHDNLRNLGVEAMDVVNYRHMGGGAGHGPAEGSIEAPFTALAELQRQGLIRHLGVSNVTAKQVEQARGIAEVVCVQNQYNVAHREDDALVDHLAGEGIAYVPFFPLGGFAPLQSEALNKAAKALGATPLQTALAWLLQLAPNVLLIPGTSSVAHLEENLKAASLTIPPEILADLDGIGAKAAA